MRQITDGEMKILYGEIEESLTTLVRSREEAILIFWLDVARYVSTSGVVAKLDFYGSITKELANINFGNEIYGAMEQQTEIYKGICEKYGYGVSVSSQGEMWKELLRGEKAFRVKILYSYLELFNNCVEPFLKRRIREWIEEEERDGLGEKNVKVLGKEWKKHKAKMQHTKEIMKIVMDVWNL